MPGFAALAEPWWVPVLYIIIVGHISNLCVTLYLHRSATHEGVKFAPPVEHFMRAWLWLTTAQLGRLATTCTVIGADGSILATDTLAGAPWIAGMLPRRPAW